MTWSLGAVFVLLVTAGNLVPRSFRIHKWYQEKFPDYPKERKALHSLRLLAVVGFGKGEGEWQIHSIAKSA